MSTAGVAKITAEFDRLMQEASIQLEAFPWENAQAYGQWLAQSHYFVRHSTRLLALAGSHVAVGDERAHKRMVEHIGEEIGHERIATNDMRALGLDIQDFPELPETKSFVYPQYYCIQHQHPMALMGYILFLEGFPVNKGPDIMKRINAAHGTKATVFLKVHVEHDEHHLVDAFGQLEGLTPEVESYILENMRMAARQYSILLDAILRTTKTTNASIATSTSTATAPSVSV